jgi:hypothetical protein
VSGKVTRFAVRKCRICNVKGYDDGNAGHSACSSVKYLSKCSHDENADVLISSQNNAKR